jgi:hypothetical protein
MNAKKTKALLSGLRSASGSCIAAESAKSAAEKTQLNLAGYNGYCALVRAQLADKSFTGALSSTSLLPVLNHTVGWVFLNNLNALVSCISHECLSGQDLLPIVDTLKEVHKECTYTTPHFEGRIQACFGLGRFYWECGDREVAAEYYGSGVKAGQDAAAQGFSLGAFAQESYEGCRENLNSMRGVPIPRGEGGEGRGGISSRTFFHTSRTLPKPNLTCFAPGCMQDLAVEVCSGCHKARYCNRECQKKDWPTHKAACKNVQAAAAAAGIKLSHPVERG